MKKLFALLAFPLLLLAGCGSNDNNGGGGNPNTPQTPSIAYTIKASYPHEPSSFTQGLVFWKGQLLEGTGLKGQSKLMQIDLATGKPIRKLDLDPQYFGEGITVLNDTLYQLTYQEKVVHVYTAKDFKKIKEFPLNTEGWGITNDGKNLIVTDGSSNLFFYDPSTFRLLSTKGVYENGNSAVNLNELEYINGYVYANQWQLNYILKIDPNTGSVVARMDLSDLVQRVTSRITNAHPSDAVLNGIAYNPDTKKVYITGKNWPELFEVDFQL
jgi:glutamine cyclotransferase